MAIRIFVEPHNGLSLPGVGHLAHGEHEVDLAEADLKGAEGVRITNPKAGSQGTQQGPESEEQRLAAIRETIAGLDKDNAELWTSGGKPQVAAIEAVLGYQITAAERDKALGSE